MSIQELRQCIGKHTKFHDCNVFEGLANALPRATIEDTQPSPMGSSPMEDLTAYSCASKAGFKEDTQPSPMGNLPADNPTTLSSKSKAEVEEDTQPCPAGMPLADPTILTTMSEVEGTQPSPMGTPPVDDPTVLSTISEAEIREDLSAAQSASPARLGEDSVALTATWVDQLTDLPLWLAAQEMKERNT